MNQNTTTTYDLADRLLTIVLPGPGNTTTSFTLDARGRIATRTPPGGSAETYAYLGTSETVWQISATATVSSALDPGRHRVATGAGGVTGFLLPDLHANLAAVTNAGETAITSATRYDPFGLTAATYDSGGSFPTNWKFQGRLDVSANPADPLYEFSARFYQPATATFSQLDTYAGSVADPLSLNRYLYAAANPWTLIDPSGHRVCATTECDPATDFTRPASGGQSAEVVRQPPISLPDPVRYVTNIGEAWVAGLWETVVSLPETLCSILTTCLTDDELELLRALATNDTEYLESLPTLDEQIRTATAAFIDAYEDLSGKNGPLAQENALGRIFAFATVAAAPIPKGLRTSASITRGAPQLERIVSLDDLASLRGATTQEVLNAIPDNWLMRPTQTGGGVRIADPARPGDQIRIMPGSTDAWTPIHAGPYAIVTLGGVKYRIPLAGNPTLR